jgi:hypothetical protein
VAFDDILRVMYVHGEIVGPNVALAECGAVEDGYSDQQDYQPDIGGLRWRLVHGACE